MRKESGTRNARIERVLHNFRNSTERERRGRRGGWWGWEWTMVDDGEAPRGAPRVREGAGGRKKRD